jgi:hypothetical protein
MTQSPRGSTFGVALRSHNYWDWEHSSVGRDLEQVVRSWPRLHMPDDRNPRARLMLYGRALWPIGSELQVDVRGDNGTL